jgi:hypothetical protein
LEKAKPTYPAYEDENLAAGFGFNFTQGG